MARDAGQPGVDDQARAVLHQAVAMKQRRDSMPGPLR
jgi:hypothetical protein